MVQEEGNPQHPGQRHLTFRTVSLPPPRSVLPFATEGKSILPHPESCHLPASALLRATCRLPCIALLCLPWPSPETAASAWRCSLRMRDRKKTKKQPTVLLLAQYTRAQCEQAGTDGHMGTDFALWLYGKILQVSCWLVSSLSIYIWEVLLKDFTQSTLKSTQGFPVISKSLNHCAL